MATLPLVNAFAKNWWVLLIRGLLAALFGIMAFAWPGLTLLMLVLIYGAYAFIDGLTAIWVGAACRAWALLIFGILGVIVGIYTFFYPGITTIALLYLIAAWAIVRGIFEIVTAIQLRKAISNEWTLIIGGIISIVFGGVLLARPTAGALAVVWIIGFYAVLFGLLMIGLAFRVRGFAQGLQSSGKA